MKEDDGEIAEMILAMAELLFQKEICTPYEFGTSLIAAYIQIVGDYVEPKYIEKEFNDTADFFKKMATSKELH